MITKNPMQLKAFIKKKASEKSISAQLVILFYIIRWLVCSYFVVKMWSQEIPQNSAPDILNKKHRNLWFYSQITVSS